MQSKSSMRLFLPNENGAHGRLHMGLCLRVWVRDQLVCTMNVFDDHFELRTDNIVV
jgi:hypothetical protein